jgi:hypothetical protein
MHIQCSAMAALLAAHLMAIPGATAQPAPADPMIATGDVWPTREEPTYVPREALELPKAITPSEMEMATGDIWPSRRGQSNNSQDGLTPTAEKDQASAPAPQGTTARR